MKIIWKWFIKSRYIWKKIDFYINTFINNLTLNLRNYWNLFINQIHRVVNYLMLTMSYQMVSIWLI